MLEQFVNNVTHNLFKPLLLFFYAGFTVPLLKVKFEFPKVLYQSLTIYLLLAIGWHGGEELASLSPGMLAQATGFMVVGFCTNTIIGILAYFLLRKATNLRQIDAATVAGYYGSDSAGTFVTCLGVLTAIGIAYAPYMPVMLAVMEIPGCLVALFLVSRLRRAGMDTAGNMPGEPGYMQKSLTTVTRRNLAKVEAEAAEVKTDEDHEEEHAEELVAVAAGASGGNGQTSTTYRVTGHRPPRSGSSDLPEHPSLEESQRREFNEAHDQEYEKALRQEAEMALEDPEEEIPEAKEKRSPGFLNKELLHEVFLNPGIFLLFAGILIGFVSRLQGERVTAADDPVFVNLFQGLLCLFLLEMGMTASQKIKHLRNAGWQFILFGLLAPNVFAISGMLVAHGYGILTGHPMQVGTYVLFGVLCGAASYIAVPAVQRIAIPEASPTLPLAASLGLTFSYNVTIGIPVYIMIAQLLAGNSGISA